ncbi:hypothetical protein NSDW_22910 [Novosphingobium olei]|nr:hypothetical protein NSDW_22910 [Novosphingobium olei]
MAFDERLHINWRDEPNLMAEFPDGTTPKMSAATCFDGNNATRLLSQKCKHLRTRELLAKYSAPLRTCAVRLENPLCQIQADNANFVHGCLLLCRDVVEHHFGTFDAVGRGHPLHQFSAAINNTTISHALYVIATWQDRTRYPFARETRAIHGHDTPNAAPALAELNRRSDICGKSEKRF